MAIVIEDTTTLEQIEQLAAKMHVSPVEAVESAVREKVIRESTETRPPGRKASPSEIRAAVERAQEAVRTHGNADRRSPDEILGYNEHGHFD